LALPSVGHARTYQGANAGLISCIRKELRKKDVSVYMTGDKKGERAWRAFSLPERYAIETRQGGAFHKSVLLPGVHITKEIRSFIVKDFIKSYMDIKTENFYNLMLFMVLFIPIACCVRIVLLLGTSFFDGLLKLCVY